ncbi:hypothetical protein D3C75_692380 [compost metagenome]
MALLDLYWALTDSSSTPSICFSVSGLVTESIYSGVVGQGRPLAITLKEAVTVSPGLNFGWIPCSASSGVASLLKIAFWVLPAKVLTLPSAPLTICPLSSSSTNFSALSSCRLTRMLDCSMSYEARFSTSAVISKTPSLS